MLSFLWWLIIGLVAGGLARLIMPGKDAMSLVATIVLGIAGSILGGLVSWAIWGVSEQGFQPAGLILSLLGAVLLLFAWRAYKSRTTV
ncbi:MAG: GlsB/YeaQ/YmgE family stress response membrane protein [Pyrinomonadaceae bacterium]